ncbi:hypothetical protein GGX14DRAFT_516199 [Mycena pura]|uniref:SET domain-containing protein n=1 Tax=Mycena pura TaxID=153505 RepID=A0AAD6VQM8_9AGAR|nr:hypothetical protein GGX14DRAFT_516199 [Mycena pura]
MDALLNWLKLPSLLVEGRDAGRAGRGLFANADIPPSTELFTIPARALVNCRTLAPHYPKGLTAVQLIALHLCLYRPLHGSHSLDPLFGPYIDSLPSQFESHPLTGHVKHPHSCELPPSVATALGRLHARYINDWRAVREYMVGNRQALTHKAEVRLANRSDDALEADFLWGWLNGKFNTRCIYHRLKSTRSHPDNLTLCPILDFANHIPSGTSMKPRLSDAEKYNAAPVSRLGDPLTLLSPATKVKVGEELYLTYGAHPNRALFVEYGFVAPYAPDDARAEVEVQDIVEQLFDNQGNEGKIKKQMLQDSAYWGNWSLDASPAVSYRLITALRLFHVPLGSSEDVQRWRDTLTGVRELISDANEAAWKRTVAGICATVIQRAKTRRVSENRAAEMLWQEELHVALRVSEAHS